MNYLGNARTERSIHSGIEYTSIRGNGLHAVEVGGRALYLASGKQWSETVDYMCEAAQKAHPTAAIISPEYATLEDDSTDFEYGGDGNYPIIDDRIKNIQAISAETDAVIYLNSPLSLEMCAEFQLDQYPDILDPAKLFCTSLAFKRGVLLSAAHKYRLVDAEIEAGVVSGHPDLETDKEGLTRIGCSDLMDRTQHASKLSLSAVRNVITHCMWAHPGYVELSDNTAVMMASKNPHTGKLPATPRQGLDNYYSRNMIESAKFHIFPKFPNIQSLVVVDAGRADIPAYNLVAEQRATENIRAA